jgi:hypothetical protein
VATTVTAEHSSGVPSRAAKGTVDETDHVEAADQADVLLAFHRSPSMVIRAILGTFLKNALQESPLYISEERKKID